MNMNCKHINIDLLSINHYSVHWHDCLELIAVVKGSVKVKDGFEEHDLFEGDVIVVNTDDLHAIYNADEENLIVILNIDMNYFEAHYPAIQNTIIVCDSNTDKKKYHKQLEAIFFSVLNLYNCSFHKSGTADEIEIENLGLELLELLMDNFRYLCVYEDKFSHIESGNLHAKTLGGAMDYIYKNFTDKITLQDISAKVNFNKYYISHLIKHVSGLSFREYINMLRAENSEKLLLTSRKSITEIAYECGFSDVKYYMKHFVRWYHYTPGVYRRKYLEAYNFYDNQVHYNEFNLSDALKRIHTYLRNAGYDVFAAQTPVQIHIDNKPRNTASLSIYRFNQFEIDFLFLNTVTSYNNLIEYACKDLALKTVRIKNIIQVHNQQNQNTLLRIQDGILDMIHSGKLNLIMHICVTDKSLKKNLKTDITDFFSKYITRYGPDFINTWIVELSINIENETCGKNIECITDMIHSVSKNIMIKCSKAKDYPEDTNHTNHIYDTIYVFPHIIKNLISKDNGSQDLTIKIIDSQMNNQTIFCGDSGLITCNGFKKASYNLYFLLAKLGENIIEKRDSYVLAKNKLSYQILLFNFPSKLNVLLQEDGGKAETSNIHALTKKFTLTIDDLKGTYRLKKYTINRKYGSVYDIWSGYGSPKFLSEHDEKLLSQISFPKVEMEQLDQGQNKIELELEPFTVQLLEITKA